MTLRYITDGDGNPVSFDQIYTEHVADIFQYVLRRVGVAADAEDLTSNTFYKALRGCRGFRHRGVSLSAWLYRIATNEVNAYFRRGGVRKRYVKMLRDDALDGERANVESELMRHEAFGLLSQSIRELKPLDQSLIALRYFENKPFADIAQIVGKRRTTVITRTHRALAKLKDLLEEKGIDYEGFRERLARSEQTHYNHTSLSAQASS